MTFSSSNFDEKEQRWTKTFQTLQFLMEQNLKYAQELDNTKDDYTPLTIEKIVEIDTYIQSMTKYTSKAIEEIESEKKKRI